MHEADLVCVWSGWVAPPVITYHHYLCRNPTLWLCWYQCGDAFLWPLTTEGGAWTLYIYMKQIWFCMMWMCGPNCNMLVWFMTLPSDFHFPTAEPPLMVWITGWDYILITTNHIRSCLSSLDTFKMELQSTLKWFHCSTMSSQWSDMRSQLWHIHGGRVFLPREQDRAFLRRFTVII